MISKIVLKILERKPLTPPPPFPFCKSKEDCIMQQNDEEGKTIGCNKNLLSN